MANNKQIQNVAIVGTGVIGANWAALDEALGFFDSVVGIQAVKLICNFAPKYQQPVRPRKPCSGRGFDSHRPLIVSL